MDSSPRLSLSRSDLWLTGRAGAPLPGSLRAGATAPAVVGAEVMSEDADLADLLARVGPGEEMPPELHRAVAEALAFLLRVAGEGGSA